MTIMVNLKIGFSEIVREKGHKRQGEFGQHQEQQQWRGNDQEIQ